MEDSRAQFRNREEVAELLNRLKASYGTLHSDHKAAVKDLLSRALKQRS